MKLLPVDDIFFGIDEFEIVLHDIPCIVECRCWSCRHCPLSAEINHQDQRMCDSANTLVRLDSGLTLETFALGNCAGDKGYICGQLDYVTPSSCFLSSALRGVGPHNAPKEVTPEHILLSSPFYLDLTIPPRHELCKPCINNSRIPRFHPMEIP